MWICERCKETKFNTPGKCLCSEFVVIDVDGEEFKYFAYDDEGAAEKHARLCNEDGDLYDTPIEVVVRDCGGVEKEFTISAWPDVFYAVREIKEGDDAKT